MGLAGSAPLVAFCRKTLAGVIMKNSAVNWATSSILFKRQERSEIEAAQVHLGSAKPGLLKSGQVLLLCVRHQDVF
mgnify:CR=1 FL=1